MKAIEITNHCGFIFKKSSLNKLGLSIEGITKVLGLAVLDENDNIISFQPCFPDRVPFLIEELKRIKLEYVDDYFIFEIDVPEWLRFKVEKSKK